MLFAGVFIHLFIIIIIIIIIIIYFFFPVSPNTSPNLMDALLNDGFVDVREKPADAPHHLRHLIYYSINARGQFTLAVLGPFALLQEYTFCGRCLEIGNTGRAVECRKRLQNPVGLVEAQLVQALL